MERGVGFIDGRYDFNRIGVGQGVVQGQQIPRFRNIRRPWGDHQDSAFA